MANVLAMPKTQLRALQYPQAALGHGALPAKSASMELSDARAAYYEQSGTASSVARKAAYAGIAVVWVFNVPANHALHTVQPKLLLIALLLVVCLALDLLQYVLASLVWGAFARILERRSHAAGVTHMEAPFFLNWPCLVCFWGKLLVLIAAYICLARFIAVSLVVATSV